jgi:PPM family protein phosphatase
VRRLRLGRALYRTRHEEQKFVGPKLQARVHLAAGDSCLATAVLHYVAAAFTDRGRKRTSNEDAFGFSVDDGVFVVCDGMGGAAAGEIASSIAVDEVLHLLAGRNGNSPLPAAALNAIVAANNAIFARAQRNQRLSGMGTTLVALTVQDSHVWVLNIGDSRCYRLRNNRLEQLTLDHSLVEEQVRLGRMTRTEAHRSPFKNVITRALGTQARVTPDVFGLEAEPGDLFLLCTDGLTRELADHEIESLLTTGQPLEEICSRLVDEAKKAGGHDNITCLLVRAEA